MMIWAGPREELTAALSADGRDTAEIRLIEHGSVDRSAVAKWCGIEPPPAHADVVIYQAPVEAEGSRTWREYRHPSNRAARVFAPEVDILFARI